MKKTKIIIAVLCLLCLQNDVFAQKQERFNHPSNHFFVKSGWREDLLTGKRNIDDFRRYVINKADLIIEGRIIKKSYQYSTQPINTHLGRERYALNTILITCVFKGMITKKTIILKTRHGYDCDTIPDPTGHLHQSLEYPTTQNLDGEAIFFCEKDNGMYRLCWEDSGIIPLQTMGDKPFINLGLDMVEKYGKDWKMKFNITIETIQKILPNLKGDREALYTILASYSNEKIKKRFLKRANKFNGNDKKTSYVSSPNSISFNITSSLVVHQGLNDSVTIQANFSGADVFNPNLLEKIYLIDANKPFVLANPIGTETLYKDILKDSCKIVGNSIKMKLNSTKDMAVYGSGYLKVRYNGNNYYTSNKLDIEYGLRTKYHLVNHNCTKGLRFKLHTNAEPYRNLINSALQKWRDSIPGLDLILETGNSSIPISTLRIKSNPDSGRVIVYLDSITVNLPPNYIAMTSGIALMAGSPYGNAEPYIQSITNGVLAFNPLNVTNAYIESTLIHEIGHGLGLLHIIDPSNLNIGNIITNQFYSDNGHNELMFFGGLPAAPFADLKSGRKKAAIGVNKLIQKSKNFNFNWNSNPAIPINTLGKPFITQTFRTIPNNPIKKCVGVDLPVLFKVDSLYRSMLFDSTLSTLPTTIFRLINKTQSKQLLIKGQNGGRTIFNLKDANLANNDQIYCQVNQAGCAFKSNLITVSIPNIVFTPKDTIKNCPTTQSVELTATPTGSAFSCVSCGGGYNPINGNFFNINDQIGSYTIRYNYNQNGFVCPTDRQITVIPCANLANASMTDNSSLACADIKLPENGFICFPQGASSVSGVINFNPYNFCAIRQTNNLIKVKLSNASGSFATNAIEIGYIFPYLTTKISISIPSNMVQSSVNYKIRIETYSVNNTLLTSNEVPYSITFSASECAAWTSQQRTINTDNTTKDEDEVANEVKENIIVPPIGSNIDFEVFPNPANTYINLKLVDSPSEPYQITVYDIQGRTQISQQTVDAQTLIDLERLESGFYIIEVKNGVRKGYKKIVVQN